MQDKVFQTRRSLIKAGVISGAAMSGFASPFALAAGNAKTAEKTPSKGIEGYYAPELKVPYWIDGKGKEQEAFTIAANKGKWIYLKCFQHWCPGCHASGFPGLQKLVSAFPNHEKIAVAAIQTTFEGFSTNNQDALRKNQMRYDLDIPFGHDTGKSTADHGTIERYPKTMISYNTGGTPWIILINPEGHVVFNGFRVNSEKLIQYLTEQFA